jgi:hypothetical protein
MAFDLTAFIAAARAAAAQPGATARIRALHVYLGALSRVRHELFRWDTGEALEFNDANFSALTRRAVEERTVHFELSARDEVEDIGRGQHRRAVVSVDRFDARVKAKCRD